MWVVLQADANALDDEVHGGVVEGSRRRLAQLDLEAGGGQRDLQIRGEPRVSAVAVVDDDARALNVAKTRTLRVGRADLDARRVVLVEHHKRAYRARW